MWNSWLVLAACAVITQSLPRPNGAYNIPAVPAGKRVQYYVLHDDGNYKYGFDTGAGTYESAVRMGNEQTGSFGFNNAEGNDVRVDYTAGVGGFQPTSSSFTPAEQPEVLVEVPQPVEYSAAESEPQEPRRDASYSFAYKTADSHRKETSDSDLNVEGEYSFVAPDGIHRQINYIAGSATGFVAEGAHLPVAGAVPAVPVVYSASVVPVATKYAADAASTADITNVLNADGSYKFNYDALSSSRSESADSDLNVKGSYSFKTDDGHRRTINYIAGADTGFVAEGADIPVAPEVVPVASVAPVVSPQPVEYSAPVSEPQEPRGDASYSFAYKTADSHRKETSDSDLNVEGEYSFVAPDGIHRQVNYIAGSATGFVAEGAHLPVAGAVPAVPVVYSASVVPVATKYSADAASTADITNVLNADGSYKFSYDALSSSRSESADSDLNVKGSYSFKTDDGHRRTINYIAGADTGFVVEGNDIPVAPEVAPVASVVPVVPQPVEYSAAVSEPQEPRGDASYSFAYKTADSHRKETSDADLNVEGEYSFVAPDGIHRQVNYIAGSATGFVAEGAHLPVAGAVPAVVPVVPDVYSASHVPVAIKYSADAASTADITNVLNEDGSYKFSYNAGSSDREESADSNLNVRGKYSFIADDGVRRRINYIAGSDTGFVATGADIPVAPKVAPVVAVKAAVIPTVYTAESTGVEASADRSDASYKFGYTTNDSDREESADADLNVEGSFSFVADDGQRRTVNYKAGSATGFIADGTHLPVAHDLPSVAPISSVGTHGSSASAHVTPLLKSAAAVVPAAVEFESKKTGDSSYSFEYANSASSRDESADPALNVKGSFKFVADDGVERTVNYVAGSATGFVAEGTHLPKAGAIPVVPEVLPSLRSAVVPSSPAVTSNADVVNLSTRGSFNEASFRSAVVPSSPAVTSNADVVNLSTRGSFNEASFRSAASHATHDENIVGNVLLRQYPVMPGKTKFGYVFTAV